VTEYKRTILEIWPVATDDTAVWLLPGDDALYTDGVPYDHPEHFEVVTALADFGLEFVEGRLPTVPLLHQTSSRENDPDADPRFGRNFLHSWVAVADARGGYVVDRWPNALPVTEALLAQVGNPPPHAADARPWPRRIDVLHHAVRHLAFLRLYAKPESRALPAAWHPHLERMEPALATLYMDSHAGRP
jgi:hypothetical protein